MNPAAGSHPDKERLTAFGLGKLNADESVWIEEHLNDCDDCNATLVNLNDDTFTGAVRSLADSPAARAAFAASIDTEPDFQCGADAPRGGQTDGVHAGDNGNTAATILLSSGGPMEPGVLPDELTEHPRYRIVKLIGRGGMGDVYRAEHRLMNRSVALKLINSRLIRNPQAVERFRREVQAAAQLTHPNIVTAFDAEQAGNLHFLAMEFVDGTDLATVVKDNGPLSVPTACNYICQAAAGLQHAHEKGMVHRDIKPHNLMVTESGAVKILDFGLAGFATGAVIGGDDTSGNNISAEWQSGSGDRSESAQGAESRLNKVAAHLTSAGSVMGTPDYIAPEQARDAHSADIRADIYSLGCTLHYLLTGKPPFETGSVVEKLKAHVEKSPPSLGELRDDILPELEAVASRMLAKDPADRFQSPRAVANALSALIQDTQSSGRKSGSKSLSRLFRWMLIPVLLLSGIIIYMATDTGLVEIDATGLDATGARVVLLKDGEEYASFDVSATQTTQTVHAGKYEVQLRGTSNDVKMNVRSKRRGASEPGEPNHPDRALVVLYRGGGLLIRVFQDEKHSLTAAGDLDRIQGEWIAESGQLGGQPTPLNKIGIQRAVFAGNQLHVEMPGSLTGNGFVSLNETTNPRQLFLQVRGENKGMRAIYRLEDDELIVCMDQNPAGELPTEFAAPAGTTIDLIVLRRVTRGSLAAVPDRPGVMKPLQPADQPVTTDGVMQEGGGRKIESGGPREAVLLEVQNPLQRKTGILSNPPPVPPGGLPVGKNLIEDPSLEDTPTGSLPQSWSPWLNDGPDFKCEVVEGGVTGIHCLQISGTGTRGVVFAASIPLDRTKRYALKGRVKVEGEVGTWAVVKLNYFNRTGWLGVDDRVGVTTSDPDWKVFEKTDMAQRYPTATLIVPTCHIEGNGTAWFDDLEVIAYDREKLPDDFDTTHGKNNRMK